MRRGSSGLPGLRAVPVHLEHQDLQANLGLPGLLAHLDLKALQGPQALGDLQVRLGHLEPQEPLVLRVPQDRQDQWELVGLWALQASKVLRDQWVGQDRLDSRAHRATKDQMDSQGQLG